MKIQLKIGKLKKLVLSFEKRERFAIQTIALTAGILTTQLIWEDFRYTTVLALSAFTYGFTAWSLREDIKKMEWLFLFILPVFFTASVSLFYFLLPGRWISRLLIMVIFAVGMYAILLVENIYNVAAIRTIQLLRAAQSIGLLITLVTIFLFSNIIYSLRMDYWINMLLVIPVIFLLSLQSLWSINLEDRISFKLCLYSFIITLIIGELSHSLSFWPVTISAYALFITSGYYTLTGVVQQHLQEKLFRNTYKEYIFVLIFTFVLLLMTSKWG